MGFRCLYPACVMAYLLMWLTLITITTGMCLMNVYEFVKVLPAPQSFRDKRRNRWIKIFLFPPVSSLKGYFSTTYSKKIFQSFFGGRNRFCNGLKSASLHSCDLLIGQLLEVIEYQPAPLRIRQPCDGFM